MVRPIRARKKHRTEEKASSTTRSSIELLETIEAWHRLLLGMAEAGHLTATLFRAVEGMAASSYEQGLRENRSEEQVLRLLQHLLQSLLSISDNYDLIVSDSTEDLLRKSEGIGLTFQGGTYQIPSVRKLAARIGREYVVAALGGAAVFAFGAVLYYAVGARFAAPLLATLAGAAASLLISHLVGRPVVTVPDLELHAGRAALNVGATAVAISLLIRAAQATESPEAHLALGDAYLQLGRVDDAQREWNMAVAAETVGMEPPLHPKG